ncbi:MAG: LytTR family DNA-binding domain-containing protein [Bacteroidota bacterium]
MLRSHLNVSNKFHVKTAFIISVWSTVFLIIISPFDVANLSFVERLVKMPGYGVILFFSYCLLVPLQNYIQKVNKTGTLLSELCIIVVFGGFVLMGSFLYYKSNAIYGGRNFKEYFGTIFLPIFIIISISLLFLRSRSQHNVRSQKEGSVIFRGESKFDVLRVKKANLICVFSAGNYVEVFYLINNKLHKKLLRSTLKKVQGEAPFLKKIHRSRLINPTHILGWKDKDTILLNQIEVGVSRKFKKRIDLNSHSPQIDDTRH